MGVSLRKSSMEFPVSLYYTLLGDFTGSLFTNISFRATGTFDFDARRKFKRNVCWGS